MTTWGSIKEELIQVSLSAVQLHVCLLYASDDKERCRAGEEESDDDITFGDKDGFKEN